MYGLAAITRHKFGLLGDIYDVIIGLWVGTEVLSLLGGIRFQYDVFSLTSLLLRVNARKNNDEYIRLTKLLKNRVKYLRNKKLHLKAQEINDYASRRQVEKLYRSCKSENSSFKEIKSIRKCEHLTAEEIKEKSVMCFRIS